MPEKELERAPSPRDARLDRPAGPVPALDEGAVAALSTARPTAVQFVAPMHAILVTWAAGPAAASGPVSDHRVPSQRSAIGRVVPLLCELPIATQLVAVAHETAVSDVSLDPPGFGLATGAQADPFQCSTKVDVTLPLCWYPTAKQRELFGHATLSNAAPSMVLRIGPSLRDQLLPSHCSTSGAASCRDSGLPRSNGACRGS